LSAARPIPRPERCAKQLADLDLSSFNEILQHASGDDIEAFGKILLTTIMGIDDAKGWLLSKGSSL
jgi:hypothetical protein